MSQITKLSLVFCVSLILETIYCHAPIVVPVSPPPQPPQQGAPIIHFSPPLPVLGPVSGPLLAQETYGGIKGISKTTFTPPVTRARVAVKSFVRPPLPTNQIVEHDIIPGVPEPYDFNYNYNDNYGTNQYRKEEGDTRGQIRGSYGYTDPSGLYRFVEYVADENGFRATIKSNEPGLVDSVSSPADITLAAEEPPRNVRELIRSIPPRPADGYRYRSTRSTQTPQNPYFKGTTAAAHQYDDYPSSPIPNDYS